MPPQTIPPISRQAADAVRQRLGSLAKVPVSLGKLEELDVRLGGITDNERPSFPRKSVVLFAGDHGSTRQGVSATNAFCRNARARLTVGDAGVADALDGAEDLMRRRIMPGSRDFSDDRP